MSTCPTCKEFTVTITRSEATLMIRELTTTIRERDDTAVAGGAEDDRELQPRLAGEV